MVPARHGLRSLHFGSHNLDFGMAFRISRLFILSGVDSFDEVAGGGLTLKDGP
jgi:hypothetical protein